jgi:hypothetical protein
MSCSIYECGSEIRGAVKKFPEFFVIDGSVHHEFVPHGQNVNGHSYVQVLQTLHDAVRYFSFWALGAPVYARYGLKIIPGSSIVSVHTDEGCWADVKKRNAYKILVQKPHNKKYFLN